MVETRIIYNPGKGCMKMFERKLNAEARKELQDIHYNAIGLYQGSVASVLYYGDLVVKTSKVYPVEIAGSCPQHITTLAFFGDTSAVETAMKAIQLDEQKHRMSR